MLDPLSALVVVVGLGVGAEWVSNRLGVPSIVLFLVAGMVVGPATGVVNPDQILGDALFPVVSLGVSIILFEGGMRLRFSGLQSVRLPILSLTTLGALVSWTGGAVLAWWILGFSPEVALLLGGILIVTGPTVVIPLLRDLEVDERLKTLTVWGASSTIRSGPCLPCRSIRWPRRDRRGRVWSTQGQHSCGQLGAGWAWLCSGPFSSLR